MEIITASLPAFPSFKAVSHDDRMVLDHVTALYGTYSDFNFNSIYSWNTHGEHQIAHLNGNVVVQLTDYITGKPHITFIGTNNIEVTTKELLRFAHNTYGQTQLKLIPKTVADRLQSSAEFIVVDDPDNHDYVFSISALATLSGNRLKSKRRAANKCIQKYNIEIIDDPDDSCLTEQIKQMTYQWAYEKFKVRRLAEVEQELSAIANMLEYADEVDNIRIALAVHEGMLIGFSIDELLPSKYVLSHYCKALPSYLGAAEYLNMRVAQNLMQNGYEYWNWEQDLGISNLRRMKAGYRPIEMLKKYTVFPASQST